MSASAAAEAASVSATSACTGTVLGDIEDLVREPCSCPLCASLCVGVPGTLSASDALALKETLGGSVCALLARTTFTTVGGAIVLRPKTAGEPGGHTSGFPVQRGACTFLDARTGCTLTYGAGKPAECCSSYQCSVLGMNADAPERESGVNWAEQSSAVEHRIAQSWETGAGRDFMASLITEAGLRSFGTIAHALGDKVTEFETPCGALFLGVNAALCTMQMLIASYDFAVAWASADPPHTTHSGGAIQTPDQILAMVDQHVSKHLRDAVKNYAIEHASIAGMARCAPARAGRFTVADIDTFKERLKEHLAAITDGYQHIGVTPSVSLTEFLNALRVTALRRVLQFARQR